MVKVNPAPAPPVPVESTSVPSEASRSSTSVSTRPSEIPGSADRYVAPTYVMTSGFGKEQLRVIPDGAKAPESGQWIYKSEVSKTQAMLDGIMEGSGSLSIKETTKGWLFGLFSKEVTGFKARLEGDLRQLARTPLGRELLKDITSHSQKVVIRPTTGGALVEPESESGARKSSAGPGGGSGATVYLPAEQTDTSYVVYRKPMPIFQNGKNDLARCSQRNRRDRSAELHDTGPRTRPCPPRSTRLDRAQGMKRTDGYTNEEEFQTIRGDYAFTENKIRKAFDLPARYGHFHHKV